MANKRGSSDGLKNLRSNEPFVLFVCDRDAATCELVGESVAPPTKGESMNICGSTSAYLDAGLAAAADSCVTSYE